MKVLHLEDDANDIELVRRVMAKEWPGCEVTPCAERAAFVAALDRGGYDLILSDYTLGAFNGMEALQLCRAAGSDAAFVFLSGTMGEDLAISTLQSGADDYILKDRSKRLVPAIHRALQARSLRQQRRDAERTIGQQIDLLNQTRDAMVVTDLEHRVRFWNQGAVRLMGWPTAEAMGKDYRKLFGPVAVLRLGAAFADADRSGEWLGELEVADPSGAYHQLEVRLSAIPDPVGRPCAYLMVGTDLTEYKQLEEQLLRAQRIDNIGLLAAGIAHDLNNILTPILMTAPLLRERIGDPGDLKLLGMLEDSAERGAALVRQILAFAHGVAGDRRPLEMKHLVRELGVVVAETFPKSIRFKTRLAPDLRLVEANAIQMHQVLLNLCLNARDAMPKGGELRIEVDNVELNEAAAGAFKGGRPGLYLLMRVSDTGTGIPAEILAQMWRPFFTTKEPGKGTGLGLSTVRGILESHGGFCQVDSALGRGTTFNVYLPAAQAPAAAAPAPRLESWRRGHGELLLIVDDEQAVRDLACAVLTRAGYRVLAAGDGAEAIGLYAAHGTEVRLVISDTRMPRINGRQLAEALQRMDPRLKILAMSGLSEGDDDGGEALHFQQFAAAFLRKPFKSDALLNIVEKLIRPSALA